MNKPFKDFRIKTKTGMIICEYPAIMIFESNGGVSKKLIWTFIKNPLDSLYTYSAEVLAGNFKIINLQTKRFCSTHATALPPRKKRNNIVTSQFAGVNPTETYYIITLSTKGNLDHIGMKTTNIDHHLMYIYIKTPGTPKNNL